MNIYAMFGVEPEIQAYAMARYSRSALSMADSISELTAEKAESFLNTFYFEYGHRSIADMAHLAMAVEDISILAAIRVVDEQLWDGQERSTRYQVFRKGSYIVPADIEADKDARRRFSKTCDALFQTYGDMTAALVEVFVQAYPKPNEMPDGLYRRTLRARAFDISRGLLPVGTKTSIGQVVSARVLEGQISRLLSDPVAEVREVGDRLRQACLQPAMNPKSDELSALLSAERLAELPDALREPLTQFLARIESPRLAPTLVKYTEPVPYPRNMLTDMAQHAASLPEALNNETATVRLAAADTSEREAVATLLYRADPEGRSYSAIQRGVQAMDDHHVARLLAQALEQRGSHDEFPRELRAGYALNFDMLIDIGAFRDLHRHRRCIQIVQDMTFRHGYDDPETVFSRGLASADALEAARNAGLLDKYASALDDAGSLVASLQDRFPESAVYALPLAYKTRALFKMDAAEAAYIIEQRTGEGGHPSYRHIAWEMLSELTRLMPEFARHVRATDPNQPIEMLNR